MNRFSVSVFGALLSSATFAGGPALPDVFAPGSLVLFQGDSVTSGGRGGDMNHYLGHGYQWAIASRYMAYRPDLNLQFVNRAVSGETSSNLVARWSADCTSLVVKTTGYGGAFGVRTPYARTPDFVSILIGINDYLCGGAKFVPVDRYESNLCFMVTNTLAANPKARIVLAEPFRLPLDASPDFCARQAAVARVALRYGLPCVPFQRLFGETLLCEQGNPRYWIWDSCHPTPAAHARMADFWIDFVGRYYAAPPTNTALIPQGRLERDSYDWYARHAKIVREQVKMDPEVVLIGDSITHFWTGRHKEGRLSVGAPEESSECFRRTFGAYRTLDMGFGWDRIQNVLWRLDHGEMDGVRPKAVVVHIGTNNTTGGHARPNTAEEIAEGIVEVCRRVREKAPAAKIVLMAVFPRGRADCRGGQIGKINSALTKLVTSLGDGNLVFLDIGERFVDEKGCIRKDLMFDGLHPTDKGYDVWGEELGSYLKEACGH